MSRQFRSFLRRKQQRYGKSHIHRSRTNKFSTGDREGPICYNCQRFGHVKRDCPDLVEKTSKESKEKKKTNKKDKKPKRKVLRAHSDSETSSLSSSDEEINLSLMARGGEENGSDSNELNHNMEEDPRFKVFKKEWFENKDCLDIGCNQGLVTINIAKKFLCRSIMGIDIDKGLIKGAKCNLRNSVRRIQSQDILGRVSIPKGLNSGDLTEQKVPQVSNEENLNSPCHSSLQVEQESLQKVSFHCENFIEDMRVCYEKYDTILCLSVTKWIHLNWGDDGLLTLFVKIWRLLKPGGVFLLEPQPWTSYKRNRLVSEITRTNFSSIHLHPNQFQDILLDKIGFRSADTITESLSGTVAGFDRPIIAFQK